jgi:hypothetical protein
MKIKTSLYQITVEEKYSNCGYIGTAFTVGCYPNLTENQAKAIVKILYPNGTFVKLTKL